MIQAVSLCMHRALQLDPHRADAWHRGTAPLFVFSVKNRWLLWDFHGEHIENLWKSVEKYGKNRKP